MRRLSMSPALLAFIGLAAVVVGLWTTTLLDDRAGLRVDALAVGASALPVIWLWRRQVWWRNRERLARRDPLTGLPNRRALLEHAGDLLVGGDPRRLMALLLIDLTDFKYVNDTLGHAAGDVLLQQVAGELQSGLRDGELLFRMGGDEFAVLLDAPREERDVERRAEYLLQMLGTAAFTVEGVDLVVDASMGLALAPDHGANAATLLQCADVAMHQAKRARAGVVVYDAGNDPHSVARLAMVKELRQALDNEEFVLFYQPKVSLPDRRVTSVEALLRWQHPDRGLLLPGDFLPVLESSGLMQAVTRWVLREAIHQAATWRLAGLALPVAVNINPRSLLEYDLPTRVLGALSGADLPASFLELEITETAVMTDPRRAASILEQLKARGVRVAIDDFGAGYTSLAHLRSLPIASLKLDRTLISHMLERPTDHAVTDALIALAHRLGLSVIAEGVETEDVMQRLAALGCDEAQGYLIAVPMPASTLEAWLAEYSHGSQDLAKSIPPGR